MINFRIYFNHSKKLIFLVLILSLFSCNITSKVNDKRNKINKVEFKIKKTNGVNFYND